MPMVLVIVGRFARIVLPEHVQVPSAVPPRNRRRWDRGRWQRRGGKDGGSGGHGDVAGDERTASEDGDVAGDEQAERSVSKEPTGK